MVTNINIGILLVTFVAFAISLQEKCPEWTYGNCDPGPDCENEDPITGEYPFCIDCCDGGFFSIDNACDGIKDCNDGYDEDESEYCPSKYRQSKVGSCLYMKQNCTENFQCCSNICKDGICWREGCK